MKRDMAKWAIYGYRGECQVYAPGSWPDVRAAVIFQHDDEVIVGLTQAYSTFGEGGVRVYTKDTLSEQRQYASEVAGRVIAQRGEAVKA